jgi:hypothetical protein
MRHFLSSLLCRMRLHRPEGFIPAPRPWQPDRAYVYCVNCRAFGYWVERIGQHYFPIR